MTSKVGGVNPSQNCGNLAKNYGVKKYPQVGGDISTIVTDDLIENNLRGDR